MRDVLVEGHGVDPDRLLVEAYGESRPEAEGSGDEERARNRRVVFELEAVAGAP